MWASSRGVQSRLSLNEICFRFVVWRLRFECNYGSLGKQRRQAKLLAHGLKLLRAARDRKSLNRCVVYTLPNDSSRSAPLAPATRMKFSRKLAEISLLKSHSCSETEIERRKCCLPAVTERLCFYLKTQRNLTPKFARSYRIMNMSAPPQSKSNQAVAYSICVYSLREGCLRIVMTVGSSNENSFKILTFT